MLSPALGPVVSAGIGACCRVLALQRPAWSVEFLLRFAGWWCLSQAILSAPPLRYRKWMGLGAAAPSDGLRVLEALRLPARR